MCNKVYKCYVELDGFLHVYTCVNTSQNEVFSSPHVEFASVFTWFCVHCPPSLLHSAADDSSAVVFLVIFWTSLS